MATRAVASLGASVILFGTAAVANACLWDYDTLKMERRQFPSTLELITGKFLRHSPDYYQWRIRDRKYRLEREPGNLALYDDLAAAYDKTGRHDRAVEIMLKKEQLKPGLYETYANLGTFYIHGGKPEEGLRHIKRAIEINPDAHFGREVYQQLLVEYVLEIRNSGRKGLPLSPADKDGVRTQTFAKFVLARQKPKDGKEAEVGRAVKGVLGMMRFGKHDSPILLEALGDLLDVEFERSEPRENAKRLAARAFLKASYEVKDHDAKGKYRWLAEQALRLQADRDTDEQISLARLEIRFQTELDQGNEWYEQIRADEAKWVQSGADVDFEYSRKYYDEPTVSLPDSDDPLEQLVTFGIVALVGVALVVALVVYLFYRRRNSRSRTHAA
jgi:tetratricopeptide (TPR) repeat protein